MPCMKVCNLSLRKKIMSKLWESNNLVITFITFSVIALSLIATPVSASRFNSNCPNIYGADCPTSSLIIDKKIQHPQSGELLDTLSSSSVTFLPGQEVTFRIEVKNTGNTDLWDVKATDRLPDFVEFVTGPGSFDAGSRSVNWSIDKITPGETKQYFIKVKVKNADQIPDLSLTCVTNFTEARKDNLTAQDTAAFCIQSKVLGIVKELPKTGVSLFNVLLGTTIISAGFSLFFIRKNTKIS